MARNKSIPDDRLIALIHSYFNIECKPALIAKDEEEN